MLQLQPIANNEMLITIDFNGTILKMNTGHLVICRTVELDFAERIVTEFTMIS